MDQHAIPLVKAAFKKQFAETMLNNGLSPDDYFEQVGLPIGDLDKPEALIPVKPFYLLSNLVAVQEGIPDFGAQVAVMNPWHQVESLAPLLAHCTDLATLLTTFCNVASTQRTGVRFIVEEDKELLWFNSIGIPIIKNDIQMEFYRITSMIQLVQQAAGPDWHPKQIQLLMNKTMNVKACNLIHKSDIAFSQEKSGISISADLLKLPVNIIKYDAVVKTNDIDVDIDFIASLRHVFAAYIKSTDLTLEKVATITGIHVRTLQRRLKQHELNFTDLLNEAKFNLAKDKLENTSLTIMEISVELGYSDPANFTRAFQRWTGMTPSEYREQN